MRQGITAVRKELDASVNASNQEIEDALWYYYFDVAKSVEYIKGNMNRCNNAIWYQRSLTAGRRAREEAETDRIEI